MTDSSDSLPQGQAVPLDAVPAQYGTQGSGTQPGVFDAALAAGFIDALGKNGTTRIRAFPAKGAAGGAAQKADLFLPDGSVNVETIERWQQQRLGVYFVVNNGGDTKASITEIIGYFAEFDNGTKEEQLRRLNSSPLLTPSYVIDNGGKSLHLYWVLDEPIICRAVADCPNKAQWTAEQERIIAALGSDPSIKDPSRVMRLPAAWYVRPDGSFGGQAVVRSGTGKRYSRQEFLDHLPELPEPVSAPSLPLQAAPAPPAAQTPQSDIERTRRRMLEQLRQVPPRIPSSTGRPDATRNTRDLYTKLLWAMADALGDAEAAALMSSHSPLWAAAEDLLQKCRERTPGKVNPASFFYLVKKHWHITDPPRAAAPDPFRPAPQQPTVQLLHRSDLEIIRQGADRVVREDVNRSRPQMIHRLREIVEDQLVRIPSSELYRREIGDAIHRRDGISSSPFVGGQELPDDDDEWVVRDIIMAGALNMLSADPKAGKTLFVLHLLAVLLHGCGEFLGQSVESRFDTVIIVGPDQSIKLWKKGLRRVGLVDGNRLDARIVRIWDSTNPWVATYEGMAELRQACKENPRSLVIFDSFSRVTEKLGIEENSKEASEVLSDIELACITYGCTPIVVTHNAKAATRTGIVSGAAIRGHSSIRANASQIIVLSLVQQQDPKNRQRRLVTEGRGDEPQDILIRMEPEPLHWVREGDFSDYAHHQQQQKTLAKLVPAQQQALAALKACGGLCVPLREIWQRIHTGSTWDPAESSGKNLSRTLRQLLDKGLLRQTNAPDGRLVWSLTTLCDQLPPDLWNVLDD